MPDTNYNFCAVPHGNDIYLLGGGLKNRVLRLDTATEIFYNMPAMGFDVSYSRYQ